VSKWIIKIQTLAASSLLKIPERNHFKVLSAYNPRQYSQPNYLRELFTIQPTHPLYNTWSSSCLSLSWLWSLLKSSSSAEPFPSLHDVFGTICRLNSELLLFFYHQRQSPTVILPQLLGLSLSDLPLKIAIPILRRNTREQNGTLLLAFERRIRNL